MSREPASLEKKSTEKYLARRECAHYEAASIMCFSLKKRSKWQPVPAVKEARESCYLPMEMVAISGTGSELGAFIANRGQDSRGVKCGT